jgi:hypothetical protein
MHKTECYRSVTRLSIQSEVHFVQDVVHRLNVDTRYRFIHKYWKLEVLTRAPIHIKAMEGKGD